MMDLLNNIIIYLKKIILNYSPENVIDYLYRQKKKLRRLKFKINQKTSPLNIDYNQLTQAFKEIGLETGDKLFMHSAMSSIGYIDGGARTVIDAIEEVVGENGLIAMPAFPVIGNTISFLNRGEIFDIYKSPSNMGKITEEFRKLPDVERSLHPTHSICAKGFRAREFISDHEKSKTPVGMETPFGKMVNINMMIVSFGAGIVHFTLQNTFADYCGEKYPFNIYFDKLFEVECKDWNGDFKLVKTLINNPDITIRRWEKVKSKAQEIRKLLEEGGYLKIVKLGKGEIIAIRAKDFMSEFDRLLNMGVTVYDLPIEKE